ncbi:hypothetical protein DFS33DRAFT_1380552 [Desarmillaria ectypa]|nr:hypothetical protein DFS33DRAFT_1380552 [Desarmillaria ectypa]
MLSTLSFIALFVSAVHAGKRGLAWPYYNSPLDPSKFNTGNGKVVAIYDWETYAPPSTNGNGGLGFIGMQRCIDCDSSPIAELSFRHTAQGWATVFTLNEPDISGISASDAAAWYITYINPLSIKKAFPAVTSSTSSGQGLDWLAQMISACAGQCYADYINLHWYGSSFSDFQSYIEKAHGKFPSYDIVITEFALTNPSGGATAQASFFTEAFSWLDSQDYVILYFPFSATSPSLMSSSDATAVSYVGTGSCLYNSDGSLSTVGNLLLS